MNRRIVLAACFFIALSNASFMENIAQSLGLDSNTKQSAESTKNTEALERSTKSVLPAYKYNGLRVTKISDLNERDATETYLEGKSNLYPRTLYTSTRGIDETYANANLGPFVYFQSIFSSTPKVSSNAGGGTNPAATDPLVQVQLSNATGDIYWNRVGFYVVTTKVDVSFRILVRGCTNPAEAVNRTAPPTGDFESFADKSSVKASTVGLHYIEMLLQADPNTNENYYYPFFADYEPGMNYNFPDGCAEFLLASDVLEGAKHVVPKSQYTPSASVSVNFKAVNESFGSTGETYIASSPVAFVIRGIEGVEEQPIKQTTANIAGCLNHTCPSSPAFECYRLDELFKDASPTTQVNTADFSSSFCQVGFATSTNAFTAITNAPAEWCKIQTNVVTNLPEVCVATISANWFPKNDVVARAYQIKYPYPVPYSPEAANGDSAPPTTNPAPVATIYVPNKISAVPKFTNADTCQRSYVDLLDLVPIPGNGTVVVVVD